MPPPLTPGGAYKQLLTVAFTLSGAVSSFDAAAQQAFKEGLASQLVGVRAEDIALTVAASSVQVSARILAPDVITAQAAATTLSTTSVADLSAALGQTVEVISETSVAAVAVLAPSPPPPSPPPPSMPPLPPPPPSPNALPEVVQEGSNGDALIQEGAAGNQWAMLAAGVAVGVGAVLLLLLLLACCYIRREKLKSADKDAPSRMQRVGHPSSVSASQVSVIEHPDSSEGYASPGVDAEKDGDGRQAATVQTRTASGRTSSMCDASASDAPPQEEVTSAMKEADVEMAAVRLADVTVADSDDDELVVDRVETAVNVLLKTAAAAAPSLNTAAPDAAPPPSPAASPPSLAVMSPTAVSPAAMSGSPGDAAKPARSVARAARAAAARAAAAVSRAEAIKAGEAGGSPKSRRSSASPTPAGTSPPPGELSISMHADAASPNSRSVNGSGASGGASPVSTAFSWLAQAEASQDRSKAQRV